jgi:hypothetical protein
LLDSISLDSLPGQRSTEVGSEVHPATAIANNSFKQIKAIS